MSFNGATPFQAWKLIMCNAMYSMINSFNGATPFQAWKPLKRAGLNRTKIALQWGHAFSGVETHNFARCPPIPLKLQWGHAFSGVETTELNEPLSVDPLLQWGHAFSGVETGWIGSALSKTRRRPRRASMGPRLFRRGNVGWLGSVRAYKITASMGPRLFRRGNSPSLIESPCKKLELQWGHAFSGVETC